MTESLPHPVTLPVRWVAPSGLPVMAANQFLIQVSTLGDNKADEALLSVGYVAMPVFVGSPEEQAAALSSIDHVDVEVVGRYSLTRQRLTELIGMLQKALPRLEGGDQ